MYVIEILLLFGMAEVFIQSYLFKRKFLRQVDVEQML